MSHVVPADWRDTVEGLMREGFVYLDLLTGIDRGEEIEVIVRVVDPTPSPAPVPVQVLSTRVPSAEPRLPSLADLHPAAAWHERETAEMFGVVFDGHPDPRPLLRRTMLGGPPLRKSTILAARVVTPWPGAGEAGGRASRRHQPPGVPAGWLREEGT